jgi:ProP effector
MSLDQRTKRETLKKTLTWLCERFPQCFNLSSPKPLKRHIEADIFLQLPKDGAISRRSIRFILTFYVKRGAYYRFLLENSYRFNLDGLAAEEVESSHKEHAKTVLEQKVSRKILPK